MNLWRAHGEGTVGDHARQGQGAAGAVGVDVDHAIGFDGRLERSQHLIPRGAAGQAIQAWLHGVGVCHSPGRGVGDAERVFVLRTQDTGEHQRRNL